MHVCEDFSHCSQYCSHSDPWEHESWRDLSSGNVSLLHVECYQSFQSILALMNGYVVGDLVVEDITCFLEEIVSFLLYVLECRSHLMVRNVIKLDDKSVEYVCWDCHPPSDWLLQLSLSPVRVVFVELRVDLDEDVFCMSGCFEVHCEVVNVVEAIGRYSAVLWHLTVSCFCAFIHGALFIHYVI